MELQRGLSEFEAAGVWVAAISNDPVGALAQFCDEHAIGFEFLSDDGSRLIRELGILNTLIETDEPIYGIPYPGAYLLDERGVIVAKYFHREYQVREAAAFVLAEGFGLAPRLDGYPRATASGEGATLQVVLGAPDLKLRQRVNLHVRVTPAAGWTLAGEPRVSVDPGDDVEVRAVRGDGAGGVRVEILSGARDVESVPVDVTVATPLLDAAGAGVTWSLGTRIQLPVGELNRARRDG